MDDIMTLEEVAGYLKLKPQTIYTWAQDGKIPAAKLGKEWRFRKSVIDRWFNQHIDEKFSVFLEPLPMDKPATQMLYSEPAQ
jgi:excisionase family DNA binding protein